jgi:pimeloyl-ACP methyl ester carboxylesterase
MLDAPNLVMAMRRQPIPPLQPGWLIVDGLPVYHRFARAGEDTASALVHVHGFGISGTYLEPTAARLAGRFHTYVPDLPGMGRSHRPAHPLDLPALARSLVAYCDAVDVGRATFVANSLGCPILVEVASTFPDRIDRVVLVSPAGGPNNQPLPRALRQMALDATREPISLLPIAVGDYLRFGLVRGWALFQAMTRYPTLERLGALTAPTLVIAGMRDPLVRIDRAHVFHGLPHVTAVQVSGAHALNFSRPELIAHLIAAHVDGLRPTAPPGSPHVVQPVEIGPAEAVTAR